VNRIRKLSHRLAQRNIPSGYDPSFLNRFGPDNRKYPEADKWRLSQFILDRLVPVVGVHPFPLDEQLFMCSTVAYFKPEIIIEWGTHKGASARIFYEIVRFIGLSIAVHSIDLPPEANHVENLKLAGERGRLVRDLDVRLHLGDGLDVAKTLLQHESFALFFLDGDHSYASVRRELNGVKQLSSRGVVLVHDTFLQGPESGYNIEPYQALQEFTRQNRLPQYSTVLGLPGMSLSYWGFGEELIDD
jgi:predicted O-methyltransferase YrrM